MKAFKSVGWFRVQSLGSELKRVVHDSGWIGMQTKLVLLIGSSRSLVRSVFKFVIGCSEREGGRRDKFQKTGRAEADRICSFIRLVACDANWIYSSIIRSV